MTPLGTQPVQQVRTRPPEQRWLIKDVWADEAVGIIGGEPKCGKSFLALQIAVAVASGTSCLGRFTVAAPGRVLVYAAEDPLHLVRERVEGICQLTGADFETLDLHFITRDVLRIDLPDDQRALASTVETLRPTLLVLDPFVRLHRVDENASGEIAPILARLRALQRQQALAIILVHHARKGGNRMRAGQALRGSSEFHAWGDSNLYLHRVQDRLSLTFEHRAHPALEQLHLALRHDHRGTGLVIDSAPPAEGRTATISADERITGALRNAERPLGHAELRTAARLRSQVFCQGLSKLVGEGTVVKQGQGYRLTR